MNLLKYDSEFHYAVCVFDYFKKQKEGNLIVTPCHARPLGLILRSGTFLMCD